MASGFPAALSPAPPLTTSRSHPSHNKLGLSVSVDNLGERVTNADEARHSAHTMTRCWTRMKAWAERQRKPEAYAHGAGLDEGMAMRRLRRGGARGADQQILRIDMQGKPTHSERRFVIGCTASRKMPGTWGRSSSRICFAVKKMWKVAGEEDRIRLCKGAYKEAPKSLSRRKLMSTPTTSS